MNFTSSTNFVSTTFSLRQVDEDAEDQPASTPEEFEETRNAIKTAFLACTDIINLNCEIDRPVPMGNEGAELIGMELRSSWVTTLWLEGQHIGPDGAAAIGDGIEHNSSITSISLANNPIQDSGFQALANSISSSFCPVRYLNLRNCNLVRVPFEIVDCKNIENVQLGDNPITFPPKHVVVQGTFMLIQFLVRHMEEEQMMASTMAHTGQLQSMLKSIHGESANLAQSGGNMADSKANSKANSKGFGTGGIDDILSTNFRSGEVISTRGEFLLESPMEPEDRACGTWWHSVLPSMDPVALTWKRKETAENKEEQSNMPEVQGLVYCDLGEAFSPFSVARRGKSPAKNRSPIQNVIESPVGIASPAAYTSPLLKSHITLFGSTQASTGASTAKAPPASDKRGRRMALV